MSNCNCNSGQSRDNGGVAVGTPAGLEIPFDRVTYRDGQLLTANDLASDETRNARLRQLHTHYLHNTWGIAIGYGVSGADADNVVEVGPGYAVDGAGRELVLANTAAVPVPFLNGPILRVLVMNYRQDATFRKTRNSPDVCLSGDSDGMTESPAFEWRSPEELSLGSDVPLASALVNNGALVGALDLRVRRYAQKLTRPYVASGATDPGRTGWQIRLVRQLLVYRATISTSDAGFNSTPFYFPVLHMPSNTVPPSYGIFNSSSNKDVADFSGPFTFLDNPGQTSFDFNVVVPRAIRPEQAGWTVAWLGVELAGGCIPPFRLLGILFRFPFLLQRLRNLVRV